MRTLPAGLAAHVAQPVTTLAHGWRLTRSDGVVLGFTDHDAALRFDGTRFDAATGLTGSEAEEALGLSAQTREVAGALSSAAIDADDIRAGRYDGAKVETFVFDWQRPDDFVLMDVAELGEVKHGETGFSAELRGIAGKLDRVRGRSYRRRCDAVFGDTRCGFPASAQPHTIEAEIVEGEASRLVVAGDLGGDRARFGDGRAVFLDGARTGFSADVLSVGVGAPGTSVVTLADAVEIEAAAGNRVRLTIGCDKRFSTCRDRFGNSVNFRGFPHMPGGDAALSVAKRDGVNDGSPVVP